MNDKIRTIHFGLGYVGTEIARLVSHRRDMEIVGAIDIDEAKVGLDLGRVLGEDQDWGIVISDDPQAVLTSGGADIVVHCTGSYLPQVYPQLVEVIEADLNLISTCEELAYPALQHPDLAHELDRLARQHGVTVLGSGINPGFVMDKLVVVLSGATQEVKSVRVTRVVDASQRRFPLQKKVGAGLSVEEFEERVKKGTVRHVGLRESAALIAASLGWELDDLQEMTEPVVATRKARTRYVAVEPGQVAGVRQVVQGLKEGVELIRLELQMYLDAEEPRDSIYIEGTPNIDMTIAGGIHGDRGTAAVIVNSIPSVVAAPPGLVTVEDLPPAGSVGVT
ncbi:MAG: dihydrodipicolinate reductase [Anaerolineae bacterium]